MEVYVCIFVFSLLLVSLLLFFFSTLLEKTGFLVSAYSKYEVLEQLLQTEKHILNGNKLR